MLHSLIEWEALVIMLVIAGFGLVFLVISMATETVDRAKILYQRIRNFKNYDL